LIIVAKLPLQQLWKEQVSWDDKVSEALPAAWHLHRSSYEYLASFDILRYITTSRDPVIAYKIHGFCDSSEKAYGAVVYVVAKSDILTSTLLVSKTRVAPLKKISIPRLELCSAVLLAQLIQAFVPSLNIKVERIHLWSHSMVALHWIAGEPYRWTTFVANRVIQIQQIVPTATWRHVAFGDNPADVASRGLTGAELITCDLW